METVPIECCVGFLRRGVDNDNGKPISRYFKDRHRFRKMKDTKKIEDLPVGSVANSLNVRIYELLLHKILKMH